MRSKAGPAFSEAGFREIGLTGLSGAAWTEIRPMRRPVRQYPGIYWAFAVLILAAAYVCSMDYCTRGKWIAPLDDVYISLMYARNALDGFPFRFNVTDGPSAGATSFLYTWLLVPVCAICKGERSVIIGLILLNAVLLWLTCRISFDLATFCNPLAGKTMGFSAACYWVLQPIGK